MDNDRLQEHVVLNHLQTVLLIGGMVIVLWLSARLILSEAAAWWAAVAIGIGLLFAPQISPALVLRMYKAQQLDLNTAPQLYSIVTQLAGRAGLARAPSLYYIPSRMMNAFAVGGRDDSAIGVTDGLIRNLTVRELTGVLAHEMAHVSNHDVRVMGLADLVSRLTRVLSLTGQLLFILGLPMWLMGAYDIPILGIALLILAPTISSLLQVALSRAREFNADLNAARITGDPQGLASALAKLERYQGGWLEQVLLPARRNPDPSILRTHPRTEERIQRLLELAPPATLLSRAKATDLPVRLVLAAPSRGPRQWPWGVWY